MGTISVELKDPAPVKGPVPYTNIRESFQAGNYAAVIAAVPALQRLSESISLIPLVLMAAMRANSICARAV